MALLTIFGDFDQDGRISRKPEEQDLKDAFPGIIVLPNIDADGRRLPRSVEKGSPVKLDHQRAKSGLDDEGAKIVVAVSAPEARQIAFAAEGAPASHLSLFDARYRPLRKKGAHFLYDIPGSGDYAFFIESRSLRGTPLSGPDAMADEPGSFRFEVTLSDAGGLPLAEETFAGTLAPWILLDNLQLPSRLYICEIGEAQPIDRGNHPSIADVRAAVGRVGGVDLVTIPEAINNGDAWIQDQFELGVCQAPGRALRVILHMPRLRSNVVRSELGSNLATFMPEHFPSADLGLFQDFYERELGKARDASGRQRTFLFRDSFELSLRFDRLWDLWGLIRQLYFVADIHKTLRDRSLEQELNGLAQTSFFQARFRVGFAVDRLRRLLSRRADLPGIKEGHKELLEQQGTLLSLRLSLVKKTLILGSGADTGTIRVPTDAFGDLIFEAEEINAFDLNLIGKHSSPNFGGNLEVSPPLPGAPFGKIAFGANRQDFTRAADPDLVTFLERQAVQPLVDIDTAWLDVAHVDEVMAFVPAPAQRAGVATVLASPGLGMKIIDTAFALYMEGGGSKASTAGDDENQPHPALRDFTDDSLAPITRLLRGRYWLHHVPKEGFARLEPPLTYRDMVRHYPVDFHLLQDGNEVVAYNAQPGADRNYNAAMSIRELRYFGRYTNDWLAENKIAALKDHLKRHFAGLPVVELPVLYDEVNWVLDEESGEAAPDFENEKTSAFLPNAANLQVLRDHVLVPRPYGPRAAPEVAEIILGRVEPSMQSLFTAANLRVRRLDRTIHWIKRPIAPGADNSDQFRIAADFHDGFPGKEEEEIRELILKVNHRAFGTRPNDNDGGRDLNPGWQRLVIPEGTVDLFETFIQLRLELLGLKVHFVDSWYYHIRLGEIHCGTNLLRRPPRKGPKWWEAMKMEEELVMV